MNGINTSRLIFGGLAAGLVINVILAFALGFLIVWTYAAIRTRYGPGPGPRSGPVSRCGRHSTCSAPAGTG